MAYFVICSTVLFGVFYVGYLLRALEGVHLTSFTLGLLIFKTAIEIVAIFYGSVSLFTAIAYLVMREAAGQPRKISQYPPVAIIYLCCEDLDGTALESLSTLRYPGNLFLIVHDDSPSPKGRFEVDAVVKGLRQHSLCEFLLLRRPRREGGKAGAVNYILERTGHLYEYFLLCDNDSTALEALTIERALAYFADERVAVVQCRSVAVDSPSYSSVNGRGPVRHYAALRSPTHLPSVAVFSIFVSRCRKVPG